jgi:radical SAM-linked protein
MPMRVRVTYAKTAPLRYTGHLDFHRLWERTLRRSRLPVAYSKGFNPQAHLHLAAALPLGFTSRFEMIDFWLVDSLPLDQIRTALESALPPGIELHSLSEADLKAPALQIAVTSSDYRITLLDPVDSVDLHRRVDSLLAQNEIQRRWRDKSYDLRPLIETLALSDPDEQGRAVILTRLACREGATGRPEELLSALKIEMNATRVERTLLVLG